MQNALKVFVEALQGSYKDGSDGRRFREFRYFAGLYFVLWIVVVLYDSELQQIHTRSCKEDYTTLIRDLRPRLNTAHVYCITRLL